MVVVTVQVPLLALFHILRCIVAFYLRFIWVFVQITIKIQLIIVNTIIQSCEIILGWFVAWWLRNYLMIVMSCVQWYIFHPPSSTLHSRNIVIVSYLVASPLINFSGRFSAYETDTFLLHVVNSYSTAVYKLIFCPIEEMKGDKSRFIFLSWCTHIFFWFLWSGTVRNSLFFNHTFGEFWRK